MTTEAPGEKKKKKGTATKKKNQKKQEKKKSTVQNLVEAATGRGASAGTRKKKRKKTPPPPPTGGGTGIRLSSQRSGGYTLPATYALPSQSRSRKKSSELSVAPSLATRDSTTTKVSHATYTSRVSNVSIHSQKPVLDIDDPLLMDIQQKINFAKKNNSSPPSSIQTFRPQGEGEPHAPTETVPGRKSPNPSVLPSLSKVPPSFSGQDNEEENVNFLEEYDIELAEKTNRKRANCTRLCIILVVGAFVLFAVAVTVIVLFVLGEDNEQLVASVDIQANGTLAPISAFPSRSSPVPSLSPTLSESSSPSSVFFFDGSSQPSTGNAPSEFSSMMPSSAPSSEPPTAPPSKVFTGILDTLTNIIVTASPESAVALEESSTPQSEAFEWLLIWVGLGPTIEPSPQHIVQRFALATLYYATRGDDWENRQRWLRTSVNECNWLGIVCRAREDGEDFRSVVSITLDGNALSGSLPNELLLLERLTTLQFKSNAITGSIPENIGVLSRLEEFDVEENGITGPIPTSIARLTGMRVLGIGDNMLEGGIPDVFGTLTNLERLYVDRNELLGGLPPSWGSLTALSIVSFHSNFLTGTLDNLVMGSLPNILEVWASSNLLTGTLPTLLGTLSGLVELHTDHNDLRGVLPSELGNLVSAERFYFQNNTLMGNVPTQLGLLSELKELYLHSNDLTGTVPLQVCALRTTGLLASMTADCLVSDAKIQCFCCSKCF